MVTCFLNKGPPKDKDTRSRKAQQADEVMVELLKEPWDLVLEFMHKICIDV